MRGAAMLLVECVSQEGDMGTKKQFRGQMVQSGAYFDFQTNKILELNVWPGWSGESFLSFPSSPLCAPLNSTKHHCLSSFPRPSDYNYEISPQVSPGSSSRSPSSTPSNKNFHLGPSPLLAPTSTPPVVTITPTHSVNSRLTSADSRRELERYPVWRSKDSPTLQPRSRPMPHIPKPEDNRGFQPYRPGEDMRLPNDIRHSHLTYDPAVMAAATMASYPIPPAFIPPTHLPYHAFRADEQMERYGYLRQPFFPLTPPHLIPHPSLGLIPGLRYPSELMHMPHLPQGVSYGGLVSNASSAERERVLQDLRERERKIEEAREAEMQLHRERSNSLSERDERLKVSDIRRSPPREPSHISRIHPHSSRSSSSSSSYDHAAVPMALIKKTESEDKWAHKTHQSHTSPHRSESRHDDSHRTTQGHKDKQYQRNSLHESSRTEPEKSHIPSLFPPDRRHEREPTSQKEHSKARPPPLIANHVPHEYSNHRTAEPLHSSSGLISHKAHSSAMSSDEGQSFSVKKAKMNARIPSPLNLQLQHPPKEKLSNHKTMPVLKPLDMEKPQKKFEFHYKEFQRIQSLRADAQNRNQNLLEELDKDSIPVIVSKLDLEAKKRKEVRASGIYISSESESDSDEEMEAKRDRYRRKMLRITTRSKMPLDKTEDKVAFLGAIGLVSQQTKEEIVNERRKKRRSLLKEESPSRIRKACKPETPPPSLLPPPANISTKQFKKEPDYSKKCEFLHNCHLKLSSTDKKRELESARQYVEAYRTQKRRRLVEKTSETSNEEVKEPTNDSEESLPPGTPLAVQCGAPTIPVHVPAQLYKSSSASQPQQQQQQPHQQQQLSASHKAPAYTLNNHHLLQTVPPLQNGMVHSTSKALSSAGEIPRDQMGGAESLQKGADVKKKKKSSQFSIASFLDLSHSGKHVDAQSFAQEFHNSVLRKTQKSLANQKSGSAESNRRETFFGDQQQHSSSHSMLRHHPYSPAKPISASHSSFQWPGVDQISEAYYRHKTDQELEKMILKDQLGRLQSNNIELRSKDEKLTQRMSTSILSLPHSTGSGRKSQLQSKTQESVQKEIQQLQKCFEDVKKTISNLSKSSFGLSSSSQEDGDNREDLWHKDGDNREDLWHRNGDNREDLWQEDGDNREDLWHKDGDNREDLWHKDGDNREDLWQEDGDNREDLWHKDGDNREDLWQEDGDNREDLWQEDCDNREDLWQEDGDNREDLWQEDGDNREDLWHKDGDNREDLWHKDGDNREDLWQGDGDYREDLWQEDGDNREDLWHKDGDNREDLWQEDGDNREDLWQEDGDNREDLWQEDGDNREDLWQEDGDNREDLWQEDGDNREDLWQEDGDNREDLWQEDGDNREDLWQEDGDYREDLWQEDGDNREDLWQEDGDYREDLWYI
ncbi:putative genetic suppressor element 1 isoform X2 [Apostichopus japonicus]|uniref:Putative genetic suppressor element 1 isoform X2 n=1 Tax=Stichopus japonicus TaxID=307972 RepID=A0A2G8KSA5_STIJA|nr:putative genetic suppressor element 1 isoform X2 [Apostichopus japonicus]